MENNNNNSNIDFFEMEDLLNFQEKEVHPKKTYNVNRTPRKNTKTSLKEMESDEGLGGKIAMRLSVTKKGTLPMVTFEKLNPERKTGLEKHQYQSCKEWLKKVQTLYNAKPKNLLLDEKSIKNYLEKEPKRLQELEKNKNKK